MALLLCIDTALENASVCLADGPAVVAARTNNIQKDHAMWLHRAIDELTMEAGISLHQLGAVAVTRGPGSYTGLRVGMSAAKGFCFALGIPLITESVLKLLAHSVKKTIKDTGSHPIFIRPMIDARRMEVYTGLYDFGLEEASKQEAIILNEASFGNELQENMVIFCGNGCIKWQNICTHKNAVFSSEQYHITDMCILAAAKFERAQFSELAYAEPSYLKTVHTGSK